MIQRIKQLFAAPQPRNHALARLEEHRRELIEARRAAQYAAATVTYHERVIADLRRSLNEMSAEGVE